MNFLIYGYVCIYMVFMFIWLFCSFYILIYIFSIMILIYSVFNFIFKSLWILERGLENIKNVIELVSLFFYKLLIFDMLVFCFSKLIIKC